jgi:hypothetical protein
MANGRQNWLRRLWWSGGGKDLPILTVLDNRTQPIPGHAGAGD